MVIAVGLDIVELDRIQNVWNNHRDRFLERHFHPDELEYCLKKHTPLPSLAVRFAAKEAFQKTWPVTHGWRDVWVVRDGVKPVLRFSDEITAEMQRKSWHAHLSMSHARTHATAVVILEQLKMTRAIRLREGALADADALSKLAQETWTAAFGHTMTADELAAYNERNLSPTKLRERLERNTFFLAVMEQTPVGFVEFGDVTFKPEYFTPPATLHPNSGQVDRLYVLPAFQNAGIGSRLLEAALRHPRLKDRDTIYLDVWPENHGAIRLYRRYGFTQKVGEVPFGNERDDILALEPQIATAMN